jgi:hypothetical protein
MNAANDFGSRMAAWAAREPSVSGLVLIGSRERDPADPVWGADAHSDWDFHVISSQPKLFADSAWTAGLAGTELRVYSSRVTRIGHVPKVNAIFGDAEADFVVIPADVFRRAKAQAKRGEHRKEGRARSFLQNLAIVIRPGFRFLKGARTWEPFYRQVVAEVTDVRMTDKIALGLADGFVCDYVWTLRKIERGELLTAQRMLHRELAETNFRLLHELKLRRGERSFPEARRIERVAGAAELAGVTPEASVQPASLSAAVEKSAATCRKLMAALVGPAWRWPQIGRAS